MKNLAYVLPFVALTFFSWGIYGPTIHIGQELMADGLGRSTLRPFMCVGLAYFLIAVVFPLIVLYTKGEVGNWSFGGTMWSLFAGALGAIGALGIILAFKFRGAPVYVMPLVFGCAPVVNTFVTMFMTRTFNEATNRFYIAILIVALGAAGVMANKPASAKKSKPVTIDGETIKKVVIDGEEMIQRTKTQKVVDDNTDGEPERDEDGQPKITEELDTKTFSLDSSEGSSLLKKYNEKTAPNLLFVALCISLTALCWGSYGPILHKGQMKMKGSKLRPLMCVGLAYFGIAVILPFFLLTLPQFAEKGAFDMAHIGGLGWSLFAGTLGAVGALGIVYAFNNGGKPIFVMPLVFGMAPVVNTFTTIFAENLFGQVSSLFFLCLMMVIVGAVSVLIFAPRPKPKGPPASDGGAEK